MKKPLNFIFLTLSALMFFSCATKKYIAETTEQLEKKFSQADSIAYQSIINESQNINSSQDSLISSLNVRSDTSFMNLMKIIDEKNRRLDSLNSDLLFQQNLIDSLSTQIDTIQGLKTDFMDADYSMYDLATVKNHLDSLTINQQHLSRELQYMIRDLNLIERNMMDIMNYSNNSIKSQMRMPDISVKRTLYRNNSKALQMVMAYLMNRSYADPAEFLAYIDSIYALGDNLDTLTVPGSKAAKQDISPPSLSKETESPAPIETDTTETGLDTTDIIRETSQDSSEMFPDSSLIDRTAMDAETKTAAGIQTAAVNNNSVQTFRDTMRPDSLTVAPLPDSTETDTGN